LRILKGFKGKFEWNVEIEKKKKEKERKIDRYFKLTLFKV